MSSCRTLKGTLHEGCGAQQVLQGRVARRRPSRLTAQGGRKSASLVVQLGPEALTAVPDG